MKKLTFLLGLCICIGSACAQDSIVLKSGKALSGHILSFENSTVTIRMAGETMTYPLSELQSIRYNGPATKANVQPPIQVEAGSNTNRSRKKGVTVKPVKSAN